MERFVDPWGPAGGDVLFPWQSEQYMVWVVLFQPPTYVPSVLAFDWTTGWYEAFDGRNSRAWFVMDVPSDGDRGGVLPQARYNTVKFGMVYLGNAFKGRPYERSR